ncbi:conserved Plasmodium protein, unknown function [Plasmodium ovale]|uniref:Uncharacterized protein n=1 Tax=Plasmodium ovale TaxID=36330 RepID=A0A1C3KQK9_PLAOA|nr:conserved Plasmodium protein, unknown function [Plasmodium ovale]
MKNCKEKSIDSHKQNNPYNIFGSITKYCCNNEEVDSFIIREKYPTLNNDENNKNINDSKCRHEFKQKFDGSRTLSKTKFNANFKVGPIKYSRSSKIDNDLIKGCEYSYKELHAINKTDNASHHCRKLSSITTNYSSLYEDFPHISTDVKAHNSLLSRENHDECTQICENEFDANANCAKQKAKDNISKRKIYEKLNNMNTKYGEQKKNNSSDTKKTSAQKENETVKNYLKKGEIRICNDLTIRNNTVKGTFDTEDELMLRKIKSLLLMNGCKKKQRSGHSLENSHAHQSEKCEKEDKMLQYLSAKRCNSKEKHLTTSNILLNNDKEIVSISSEGEMNTDAHNRNGNCSMISLESVKTRKELLLVDNFSQTVKKKKIIKRIRIGKRFKIYPKRNKKMVKRRKNRNNANKGKARIFKKKGGKEKKVGIKKGKPMKSKQIKNKIPVKNSEKNNRYNNKIKMVKSRIRTNYLSHGTDKKQRKTKAKKVSIMRINKKVPSYDGKENYNSYQSNELKNGNKCRGKNRKEKRNSILHKCAIESSNMGAKKKAIYEQRNDKMKIVESIKTVEKENEDNSKDNMEEPSDVKSEKYDRRVNLFFSPSSKKTNPCSHKSFTNNFRSNFGSSLLSDKMDHSSYKSFLLDIDNSEHMKRTDFSSNTCEKYSNFNEDTDKCVKYGNCQRTVKSYNDIIEQNYKISENNDNSVEEHSLMGCAEKRIYAAHLNNSKVESKVREACYFPECFNKRYFSGKPEKSQQSISKYEDENSSEKRDNDETLIVLKKIDYILRGGHKHLPACGMNKEEDKKDSLINYSRKKKKISKNVYFDKYEKRQIFRKMKIEKYIRSKSYDSFFEKKCFNTNERHIKLVSTFLYNTKKLKNVDNLFLFNSNLLQQRSLFQKKGAYEKREIYVLNSISFYSSKIKNLLNFSIKRFQQNEHAVEIKFFMLCLMHVVEKVKTDAFFIPLKKVSILINEIVEKVRMAILELPKRIEISKFESAIIKIYYLELIKMSRLLSALGGGSRASRSRLLRSSSSLLPPSSSLLPPSSSSSPPSSSSSPPSSSSLTLSSSSLTLSSASLTLSSASLPPTSSSLPPSSASLQPSSSSLTLSSLSSLITSPSSSLPSPKGNHVSVEGSDSSLKSISPPEIIVEDEGACKTNKRNGQVAHKEFSSVYSPFAYTKGRNDSPFTKEPTKRSENCENGKNIESDDTKNNENTNEKHIKSKGQIHLSENESYLTKIISNSCDEIGEEITDIFPFSGQNGVKLDSHENEYNFNDHCMLIKKLKKDLLKLEQSNKGKFPNLILVQKYLDKLSYIYEVNKYFLFDVTREKKVLYQVKEIIKRINKKRGLFMSKREIYVDAQTFIDIRNVQKNLGRLVTDFFRTPPVRNYYEENVSPVDVETITSSTYKASKELERFPFSSSKRGKHMWKQNGEDTTTSVNNHANGIPCEGKIKSMFPLDDEERKEAAEYENSYNIDETEQLEHLNDYLNSIIILYKEGGLLKMQNAHYTILKRYNQELSLLNEFRSNDNTLINDSLDHISICEFSKLLHFYIKQSQLEQKLKNNNNYNYNNLKTGKNNIITHILRDFYMHKKDGDGSLYIKSRKNILKNFYSVNNGENRKCINFGSTKVMDNTAQSAQDHISPPIMNYNCQEANR